MVKMNRFKTLRLKFWCLVQLTGCSGDAPWPHCWWLVTAQTKRVVVMKMLRSKFPLCDRFVKITTTASASARRLMSEVLAPSEEVDD